MATDPAHGAGGMVLCSGTCPNAAPLIDRITAAAGAGFTGLSLWERDYQQARAAGHTDADLRAALSANGITLAELDVAWGWTPGAPDLRVRGEPFDHDEARLFDIAENLGGGSINAVDLLGGDWSLDDAAASFASLCDRAAERGLLVHLEALPWSRIPTVTEAMAIVEAADRPNGGVMVDAWHLFRGHESPASALDAVRRLDGSRVFAVQLADGPVEVEADLVQATLHHRLLPGAGSFPLVELVRALDSIGSTVAVGVEVFSDDLQERDLTSVAQLAGDATSSILFGART